eukprot:GHVN01062629.1.p1 GENE.GHVN01062629.1~~GHVN01062629.1.p1  ORF type:complete len:306 (+),score=31.29 GHVN01062629.1:232-1149(+)
MGGGIPEKKPRIGDAGLYIHVDRIYNEVKELGLEPVGSSELNCSDLFPFDQLHLMGVRPVEDAISRLNLSSQHRLLEVGSGLGGPARFLAKHTGCSVTALELQQQMHKVATDLTKRCRLSHLINHVEGNALQLQKHVGDATFDFAISWLAFVHIADRNRLMTNMFKALNPGGQILVEDFFAIGELAAKEKQLLETKIFCAYMPTLTEWEAHATQAGFSNIKIMDLTVQARQFAATRVSEFEENRERHNRVHGATIVEGLSEFYSAVDELFEGGNLGYCVVIADKPGTSTVGSHHADNDVGICEQV